MMEFIPSIPSIPSIPGFRLLAKLGEGCSGTVYRAQETFTDRQVALKVLKPERCADPEMFDRFIIEARAVARLEHPCICRLYHFEGAHRPPYLVTQLVEGESLLQALLRGPLPEDRVATITRDVGVALAHAHLSGVLHRDVKSANILLATDGRAVLTDFGTALLLGEQRMTVGPVFIGTPGYMAPERVRGEDATASSDQFALAVVAYEALTGGMPHRGTRLEEIQFSILNEGPKPPSVRCPGLDPGWDSLLLTAMQPDPSTRFASLADFVAAVPGPPLRSAAASVAVFPLANLSGDPDCDNFCMGLAEDLVTDFAAFPGIRVVPPRALAQVAGERHGFSQSRVLMATRHRLEGSVQCLDHTLRVNVQLLRTHDEIQVWARRYDRTYDNPFQLQAELARTIAQDTLPSLMDGCDLSISPPPPARAPGP